jgi:crotonobetainyl-CoA:carnitine CoA-transferase CaiB-like acyl-CoA transferase
MEDFMIPEEKIAPVTRALREAFGVPDFENIRQLTKGNATTRVFRIVVHGSPYLLKIIMRTDDPTRHYICIMAQNNRLWARLCAAMGRPSTLAATFTLRLATAHGTETQTLATAS